MFILIIEPDDGRRERLAGTLRAAGHFVQECPDGQAALEVTRAVGFDAVVIAARGEGCKAARQLRAVFGGSVRLVGLTDAPCHEHAFDQITAPDPAELTRLLTGGRG